ncbi:MAG: hypothetical protein HZB50_10590 [Chloroflexi bacterium]|nr:hypothetical protein [Chloroflexota bacterium]
MRKNLGILFWFIFLLTACSTPATNTPAPTEVILSTPTPEPIKIPSPSEIGLASTQDAESDVALFSVETVKVDDSQLISRADLLTALELKDDVLNAYEDAIDVWLKANGFGITRKEYIFNPTVLQWRIIVRDAITSNVIWTSGLNDPFNLSVDVAGNVTISDVYTPVVFEGTRESEIRLIGSTVVILNDPVKYEGVYLYTHSINVLNGQKQLIPGLEEILTEGSKIDFSNHEILEGHIENIDNFIGIRENRYFRIKEEDLPQAVQWVMDRRKLNLNTNRPLLLAKPWFSEESKGNYGASWHVSLLGHQNVNFMPRLPLLIQTEYGKIFTILYEGVQEDENGNNQPITFLYTDSRVRFSENSPTTHFSNMIRFFTIDYIKEHNRRLGFGFCIQYAPTQGDVLSEYAKAIINIKGLHINPIREQFGKTGKFGIDTSTTIFAGGCS